MLPTEFKERLFALVPQPGLNCQTIASKRSTLSLKYPLWVGSAHTSHG